MTSPPPPTGQQHDDDGGKKHRSEDATLAGWYRMAGVGIEFVVAIGVFAVVGYLVDRWLNSSPWGFIIGAGVGFAVGLRAMIRVAMKSFK